MRATAIAHPNIALIKYWGNRDEFLRLPAHGSISMNLGGLETRTTVEYPDGLGVDEVFFAGHPASPEIATRVIEHLKRIRALAGKPAFARVETENNFPLAAGLASSASGFAALTLAASTAIGLVLDSRDLSRIARQASGSACRSIPGGFVEWHPGTGDLDSFATSLLPPEHWAIRDLVVIVDRQRKAVSSSDGHRSAWSSPLFRLRVDTAPRRLEACRRALFGRDFEQLAEVVEEDCLLLHSVMMTSAPPLLYWGPQTVDVLHRVRNLRAQGFPIAFSIDAGANVHCLTLEEHAPRALTQLEAIPGVLEVLRATPGGPAVLV
jgi:diphosphomevalonate decarboxylase